VCTFIYRSFKAHINTRPPPSAAIVLSHRRPPLPLRPHQVALGFRVRRLRVDRRLRVPGTQENLHGFLLVPKRQVHGRFAELVPGVQIGAATQKLDGSLHAASDSGRCGANKYSTHAPI
jgi:hypothetical protein